MRDDLQNLMRYNGSVPAVAALPLLLKYNQFFSTTKTPCYTKTSLAAIDWYTVL